MTVSDGRIMLSRHSVGTYQENEFTHNSSRNTRPHLPQLAEPLWTDPGLKSKTAVCNLILHLPPPPPYFEDSDLPNLPQIQQNPLKTACLGLDCVIVFVWFCIFRRNVNHLWQVLMHARKIFYKIETKSPLNAEAASL